ncbi:hypothetical protein FALCPG4_005038 [Fusarium falciforme]
MRPGMGEFGFCGTIDSYCKGKKVTSPECSGRSSEKRTIGYYEGWNLERPCGRMEPEEIPLGWYTYINFAFALINLKTYFLQAMDSNSAKLYDRVTDLKDKDPNLEVWIAIGGWAMNDPGPYRKVFSELAKSERRRTPSSCLYSRFWRTTTLTASILTGSIPSQKTVVVLKRTLTTLSSSFAV